jgi:hypothetical protein
VIEPLPDFVIPELLAGLAVERQRPNRPGIRVRGTDEYLITPDDGRGGGRPRHSGNPLDVVGLGEFGRKVRFVAGTIKIRAAPVGPILSRVKLNRAQQNASDKQKDSKWIHKRSFRRRRDFRNSIYPGGGGFVGNIRRINQNPSNRPLVAAPASR